METIKEIVAERKPYTGHLDNYSHSYARHGCSIQVGLGHQSSLTRLFHKYEE
ncbi:hypothetical protein [Aneurinibacillus migulanus]|uniref:Uncharacterized protein n=1 Tax=Aneurinibacillus migulanus TaxID=47500 RepID=A0A1G8RL06_ANEMI|nr:hypothetical protein [Aneurinibacillus migulanus]MED0893449.1 hypothetical protein [Aneurinibacillus migulanus]MED1618177.1 hypothetical protein [Aneurinibacillus migulanus]MED4727422.1 hypothetical protein [Aneurinibacillus migulanus]SDJ17678.1 hypothetical protein SAMN04487909_11340 [Aneurinibacillus migulanus]